MRYYYFGLIVIICLFFVPIATSNAQLVTGSQDGINIDLIPENPRANQKVIANIKSYAVDLNSSSITWILNGKIEKTAVGDTSFTFITGNTGIISKLEVLVRTSDGESLTKAININPASVDLIWQNESLVPPFYKGKALFSHENKITFVAIPHIAINGEEVNAGNLVYTWSKDGRVIEGASGYGKSTYTFVGSLISRPFKIEVTVYSANSDATAYSSVFVSPVEPEIIFYKKNPIYGIELQRAVSASEEMTTPEMTILAVPLFFGARGYNDSSLNYRWTINGKKTDDSNTQNVQIFRTLEGSSGYSKINLTIENTNKILQLAKTGFILSFGNNNTQ